MDVIARVCFIFFANLPIVKFFEFGKGNIFAILSAIVGISNLFMEDKEEIS